MQIYLKWLLGISAFLISELVLSVPLTLPTLPLTPPNQPVNNDFYVCYQKRFPKKRMSLAHTWISYHKYRYLGCFISRTPCHSMVTRKKVCTYRNMTVQQKICANNHVVAQRCAHYTAPVCGHVPFLLFDWYNNYPAALNGFYRCAYSA